MIQIQQFDVDRLTGCHVDNFTNNGQHSQCNVSCHAPMSSVVPMFDRLLIVMYVLFTHFGLLFMLLHCVSSRRMCSIRS